MPIANYGNGFTDGITIRGIPITQSHTGKVWFVSNATTFIKNQKGGSDSNVGSFNAPFATLNKALNADAGAAAVNRGDIIFVKPNHAETISNATTLLLSKSGVAVIGLGFGDNRPTFTFSTATTANIPVTGKNVALKNLLFKFNFANIASVFTATGTTTPTDFTIENCEFRDLSSSLNALTIFTGNATANSNDGFTFNFNRVSSLATTAATTAVVFASAADRVQMNDNYGNWAVLNDTACFLATGANSVTNFEMGRNHLQKPNTSSTGGSFVSTSGTAWTGMAYDNYLYQLDNTAGIWIATGTKLGFQNNYSPITGAADKSGLINPAAV